MNKNLTKLIGIILKFFATASSTVVALVLLFLTGLGIIYVISPIDLIPDVIPILGWLDDIIVIIISIMTGLGAIASGSVAVGINSKKDDEISEINDDIEVENISK